MKSLVLILIYLAVFFQISGKDNFATTFSTDKILSQLNFFETYELHSNFNPKHFIIHDKIGHEIQESPESVLLEICELDTENLKVKDFQFTNSPFLHSGLINQTIFLKAFSAAKSCNKNHPKNLCCNSRSILYHNFKI